MHPTLLASVILAACSPDKAEDTASASARLRAEGTSIVDARGQPVVLRGAALGGWLFHENWITAVEYPATV